MAPRFTETGRRTRRATIGPAALATLVAVESSARFDLRWLDPGERKEYWERNVAGHMDSDLPNEQGLVYQATMWTDPAGHRLLLISELC
ncbi:MAG TPA: hypothetical protein VIR27_08385 [Mycobacteriales bacterium]